MEIGLPESEIDKMQEGFKAEAQKLEEIREQWRSRIKDNDLLRRAVMADYLIYAIGPKLFEVLSDLMPNPKAFIDKISQDKEALIRFFQTMPTSYCIAQLTLYRDMQTERKIQPNDMHDIMSLSMAIPYSDVVVTERMWQTAITQTKLDSLYQTTALKSVLELALVLDQQYPA
jgi:hypothetical protein